MLAVWAEVAGVQSRDAMNTKKDSLKLLRLIAEYCADVDCRECMFFQENGCVLNYIPADKPAVDKYIKDREKEEMLFGEVELPCQN